MHLIDNNAANIIIEYKFKSAEFSLIKDRIELYIFVKQNICDTCPVITHSLFYIEKVFI